MTRRMTIEFPDRHVVAALRRKTPAERIQMALEMHRFAGDRLRTHLAHRHPDWSQEQIQKEVARRLLRGDD